jgi:murein DD-endopeptidase MepM/ murein hydrolase activator NlpD
MVPAGPGGGGPRLVGPTATVVSGWRSPIDPAIVVGPFAPPPRVWLPGHRGVDLRTAPGTPVRAAGAGVVSFVGTIAGRGVVVIDHGGLRTTYEPVLGLVVRGQRVRAGSVIGTVVPGTGHCGSGRCLHLGLKRGREYLDPLLVISRTRAVLLPW